jgi:non-heme chloroperoxidase
MIDDLTDAGHKRTSREVFRWPRRRGCYIQLPGLVTSAFLSQIHDADPPDPKRPFDLPTKSADVNGTTLRYLDVGAGEPIVFVHGSLGDYRTWGYQFEPFAEHFRVISYSRRWHYPNPPPAPGTTSYSSALHTDDLAEFLRQLGCGPVHLAGNSMGAIIALKLAHRHPELARSLILNEPGYFNWLPLLPGGGKLLEEITRRYFLPARELMLRGRTQEGVRMFVEGVMPGQWSKLSPAQITVILDNSNEFQAEIDALEWMSPFSFEDASSIRTPALVMTGSDTEEIFRVLNVQFSRLLPNAESVTVPDACHAIYASAPDAFNREVMSFLSRVRLSIQTQA